MQKKLFPEIFSKDLIYSIPGYACFLYILFPFRFWKPFVFSNQTETIVVTVFFACTMLMFSLSKAYETKTFQFTKTDLILVVYGIYILTRLWYPLEKEYFFVAFSIVSIYLYFRNFPENFLRELLLLLPLAGIIQMVYGIMQFSMPWQNVSHIMGIFNNTGLFGGFVALGLVVCTGMCLFHGSNRHYLKTVVLVALSIPLAIQVYASCSRASWLSALGSIIFLMYKFAKSKNIQWKIFPKKLWLSYFLVLCLLLFSVFFLKYLYGLKKNSADGRILIGMISMDMVKKAPVFGSGISGFRAGYMNHQAAYFQKYPDSPYSIYADDVETPFNEFMKILVEQGIAGLLLFACLLYFLFERKNSKHVIPCMTRDNLSTGLLHSVHNDVNYSSIILFILIFGLFSYPFDKLPFIALFVFSIAIVSKNQNQVIEFRLRKMNFMRIPLLIALCLITLIIALNACSYSNSCQAWNRALMNFSSDREESLGWMKKLYPELENNPVFLTTYGKALGFGEQFNEAAVILEKAVKRLPLSTSYIELGKSCEAADLPLAAIECWRHAGLMVPSRFAPLYLSMKLHLKNGKYSQAKEYAEKLLEKKIKIDNPEIDRMKSEALEILKL